MNWYFFAYLTVNVFSLGYLAACAVVGKEIKVGFVGYVVGWAVSLTLLLLGGMRL